MSSRRGLMWVAGAVGVAALTPACVVPGEFAHSDNDCGKDRTFDVASRDAYCSGSWDSTNDVEYNSLSDPLVGSPSAAVTPEFLALAHIDSTFGVRVDLHQNHVTLPFVSSQDYRLSSANSEVELGAVSLFGNVRGLSSRPVIAAVHEDGHSVSFLNLDNLEGAVGTREVGADTAGEVYHDPRNLFNHMGSCVGEDAKIADLTPFPSAAHPDMDYLLVSARCGMVVVGISELFFEPEVLAEIQIDADSVYLDRQRDRLVIASGRSGLRVRDLNDLVVLADANFQEYESLRISEREAVPCLVEECPLINEVGAGDDVVLTAMPDVTDTALANMASANVTHLDLNPAGDRLYYINEATGPDGPDASTYLIAAHLSDSGVLDEMRAIEIARDDLGEVAAGNTVSYQLVALEDNLVAVLRKETIPSAGEKDGRPSTLTVYDAAPAHPVTKALSIPDTQPLVSIHRSGDRLLVVDDDKVVSYVLSVSGGLL